jgi:hypothetical protein
MLLIPEEAPIPNKTTDDNEVSFRGARKLSEIIESDENHHIMFAAKKKSIETNAEISEHEEILELPHNPHCNDVYYN